MALCHHLRGTITQQFALGHSQGLSYIFLVFYQCVPQQCKTSLFQEVPHFLLKISPMPDTGLAASTAGQNRSPAQGGRAMEGKETERPFHRLCSAATAARLIWMGMARMQNVTQLSRVPRQKNVPAMVQVLV